MHYPAPQPLSHVAAEETLCSVELFALVGTEKTPVFALYLGQAASALSVCPNISPKLIRAALPAREATLQGA